MPAVPNINMSNVSESVMKKATPDNLLMAAAEVRSRQVMQRPDVPTTFKRTKPLKPLK